MQELKKVKALKRSDCMGFDHGRHTKLTLSVPEGHNTIDEAAMCAELHEPLRHILEAADAQATEPDL